MRNTGKLSFFFTLVSIIIAGLCINTYALNEAEPNDTIGSATVIGLNFNLNESITGVSGNGSDDYYQFTPKFTGPYRIEISGNSSAEKSLLKSDGSIIDKNETNLLANLNQGEKYFILIKNFNTISNYTIKIVPLQSMSISTSEIEYNSSFLAANIIPNNQKTISINARINQAADEDYYLFTPRIDGTYTICTSGSTDTVGYLYDDTGLIYPENKVHFATNDDNLGTTNFSITCELKASSTYYIKVSEWDKTKVYGDYNLLISIPVETIAYDIEGNDFATAKTLTVGNIYKGQMNSSSDVDFFIFSAPTSGLYRIETKSFGNTSGQSYNYNKQLLLYDNDNNDNLSMEINCMANTSYYIKVYDRAGIIGNYTLSVARGKKLEVPYQTQQPYSNLCWATCASMLQSYILNNNYNRTLEIANPNNLFSKDFNKATSIGYAAIGVEKYIDGYKKRLIDLSKYSPEFGTLPFTDITKAIDASSPVIALKNHHYFVIKGYSHSINGVSGMYLYYNDPWDGKEHFEEFTSFISILYYTPTHSENMEYEANDSVFSANDINLDVEKTASINEPKDCDWYSIFLPPGNYNIESSGNIDTFGELYYVEYKPTPDYPTDTILYPSIRLVSFDNNSGMSGNFKISFTNNYVSPRFYYFRVRHASPNMTGDYSVKITKN